jgi:hypothetical protein
MKTEEEIDKITEKLYPICPKSLIEEFERVAYKKGYLQCQEDNDWTKNCECESSIGQTWCCNQCGLPYDTRKSKIYTEEDMFKVWLRCRVHSDEQQVSYELFKNFINSLNKQDND